MDPERTKRIILALESLTSPQAVKDDILQALK